MLSRRPRSWAIPGRGIWAGLALAPVLIALAALVASAFVGGATAGSAANASAISPAAAKARVRPMITRTEAASTVASYWTSARRAKATDIVTGSHAPDVVPGPPHTSFNWYPGFSRKPQHRSVLIYYTQGGTEHVCSGGVIGWDQIDTATVDGPTNVVWTAGRCVHRGDGTAAGWSDNVMVCPIHGSTGPFTTTTQGGATLANEGCWVWLAEATTPEWFGDNWESRDYGVVFTSNQRYAGPCTATSCASNPGGAFDIAAYPPGNPKGTFTLCNERNNGGSPTHTDCAYNLARAQAFWAVGYHNPSTLQRQPGYVPTGGTPPGAAVINTGCTTTGTPNNPPGRQCFPLTLRVTQTQFANTGTAQTPVPTTCGDAPNTYTCAADTGPLVNTVGDYEQVGVDSTRLAAGDCAQQYKGTGQSALNQTAPCTGSFTGAPWIVASGLNNHGWNGNEANFGNSRINSNASYALAGEDDLPNVGVGVYGGSMQGPYFDTVTCFDYQAWTSWPGIC